MRKLLANSEYSFTPLMNGSFAIRRSLPYTRPIYKRVDVSASASSDLLRLARTRLLRFKSRAS